MNRVENAKSFIMTTVDGARVTVLPLNGSAAYFPKPWEDLSHLFKTLDLPDHSEDLARPLEIALRDINEILGIKNPTPAQEAKLTAVLSGDTTGKGSVQARCIRFNLGATTPMVAALVDTSAIDQIFTRRLLIITDLPLT